jgi:carboxymethylenebutenolidase
MNTANATELNRSREHFTCADGFSMPAYVSRPNTPAPVPGVLLIYEMFGMNDEMARIADELASEQYAVMLPDIFSRGSWFSCVRKAMSELKSGTGRGIQDLIDARNWLTQKNYVDSGRVAVMGLCMGGGFALLLGKTGLFRVSAPFYGQVPLSMAGTCPVVGSYGGKDWLAADAERLAKELDVRRIPHDMKIYPDAGHGFMNRPANGFVKIMGKLSRKMGYQPDAAADAKKRLVAFLKEHL